MRLTNIEGLIIAVLITVVGAITIGADLRRRADNACLSRGYASAVRTRGLTIYCVKRVNGTDVVARLDTLR